MQAIRNGSPVRTTVGDTFVRTATANGVAAIGSMRSAAWYLEIPPTAADPRSSGSRTQASSAT